MSSTIFFRIPLLVVRCLGFEMKKINEEKQYWFIIRGWFSIFFLDSVVCAIGLTSHLIRCIVNGGDLQEISITLFPTVYVQLVAIKAIKMGFDRPKVNRLLKRLDKIYPKTDEESIEYGIKGWISQTEIRTLQIGSVAVIMIIILSTAKTFEDMIYKGKKFWEIESPYLIDYYLIDQHKPVIHQIIFVSHFMEGSFCLLMSASSNFMLFGLVQQMCMHYKYLSDKMITEKLEETKIAKDHLKNIIEKHVTINE